MFVYTDSLEDGAFVAISTNSRKKDPHIEHLSTQCLASLMLKSTIKHHVSLLIHKFSSSTLPEIYFCD